MDRFLCFLIAFNEHGRRGDLTQVDLFNWIILISVKTEVTAVALTSSENTFNGPMNVDEVVLQERPRQSSVKGGMGIRSGEGDIFQDT